MVGDEKVHRLRFKVWHNWLEGLRVIRRERVLVGFFLVMSIAAFADGLYIVLFAPFVKTLLHGNAAEIGYLTSAQAVGGLLGGLLVPHIAKWKGVTPALLITLTGLIVGAIHLFLFNYSAFFPANIPALLCFFGVGIASIGFFVQLTTLLQTSTPDSYRGRIFGMYSVDWAFFLLLGTSLTGLMGDRVTLLLPLNIEAALFFPAAIIAWFFLRPRAASSFTRQTDQQGLEMEKEQGH